jgi:hypothetical protein
MPTRWQRRSNIFPETMTRTLETNCPFTLSEYRQLIALAKERFPLIGYAEYQQHDSFVIWRHDVEYCVPEMSVLARIDAEEGIKSTFFVQLHSELYNFWDEDTVRQIKQWVAAGHELGLHFDCGFHGDDVFQRIEAVIDFEKKLLEDIYGTQIFSFSYHNPNATSLTYQDNYAGLVNAYSRDFFNGPITYVSDSNGRWREKTIRDVLTDATITKAQINTHDTWWTDVRIPQIEKLEAAILRGAKQKIMNYRGYANIVVEDII